MINGGSYSVGWYSLSPSFAWWNRDPYHMAEIKARREAARIVEEDKKQKKLNFERIAEGTISVYA